jgi:hypothetical protein
MAGVAVRGSSQPGAGASQRAPLGEITNTVAIAAPSAEVERPKQASSLPVEQQEYAYDVLRKMLQREPHCMPRQDFMHRQPELNAQMRSILNGWLLDMHRMYGLRRETLFLTINIIDRYLSRKQVAPQQLQLVGVTGLLVAAKFEEIHPPEVQDLVYYTANAYSRQEIMDMEVAILRTLKFEVASPTAAHFLLHFQASGEALPFDSDGCAVVGTAAEARGGGGGVPSPGSRARAVDAAWYVMELSLLDIRMVRHMPSHLAAAALLLSNRLAGQLPAWPESLAHLSGYKEPSLEACAGELRELLEFDAMHSDAFSNPWRRQQIPEGHRHHGDSHRRRA